MTQLNTPPPGELNPYQRIELGTLQVPAFHAHLRRESADLAYLLGAWAGCTEIGGKPDNRISFASQDERQISLLNERIISVTGKSACHQSVDIHGRAYLRLVVHNEDIAHHFQRVTAYNSRVPWEHLGTEGERINYIRGIFDHSGWMFSGSSSGIGINKVDGEYLLRDISRVFVKVGLLPLILDHPVPSLRLKEITEWQTFAEKVPLSLPDRQRVAFILAHRPSQKNHFTVADYETVRQGYQSEGMNPAQIARTTGIPANSVRDWMIRGQKPPAVKRKEIIDTFSASMPNSDVMNAVYRTLGASSELARECSKRVTPERVVAFAHGLKDNALLYGNDELIARDLLGGWAKPS